MQTIEFEVHGIPRPQGSMKMFRARSGHTVAKYSDTTYEWRNMVTVVAAGLDSTPIDGPVLLRCVFDLPRPKSHYGTGKNAGTIKASSPGRHHAQSPDTDKLVRAIGDAITDAGTIWHDDSQVARIDAVKRWCDVDEVPGVAVAVTPLT